MGVEKQKVKERACQTCGEKFNTTAKGIKQHANLCERAAKAGLVLARG